MSEMYQGILVKEENYVPLNFMDLVLILGIECFLN
jgi:hypothetical protein